jgi:hypothetical protein
VVMPTGESAPIGSPCGTDLWTSDVTFTCNGVPIAGGMGDMGDLRANNSGEHGSPGLFLLHTPTSSPAS